MSQRTTYAVLVVGVVCLWATPAFSAIVITGPATHTPTLVVAPDGDTVQLNPDPVTYLTAATQAMRDSLAAEFAGFTFAFHAGGLAGTLDIIRYEAASHGPHNGGAILEARYTRAATDPALANLRFIQLIDTNVPLGGPTSPYIDPRPNDDNLPFYWTTAEDADPTDGDKGSGTYRFFDFSSRNCGSHPDLITWRGELILASFVDDGVNRHVDVYDGIRWGWDFTCVPEPSSMMLALAGVVAIGIHQAVRKGRHSRGPGGDDQPPVTSRNSDPSVPL